MLKTSCFNRKFLQIILVSFEIINVKLFSAFFYVNFRIRYIYTQEKANTNTQKKFIIF